MKLKRIRPGLYRWGIYEVRDTYSPDGPPHARLVTLTRDRWLLTMAGRPVRRFDTLRDAREHVEGRS